MGDGSRDSNSKPTLYLRFEPNYGRFKIPQNCREVLRADDFLGFELGDDFYLTDGSSLFHLQPRKARDTPDLASFFTKPKLAQANFWCFGLLKLLRPLGIYSLHAAGLAIATEEDFSSSGLREWQIDTGNRADSSGLEISFG